MNKKQKLITITATLLIVSGTTIAAYILFTGSTKNIEAVASQFRPNSGWKLKSESITPPKNTCIDTVCPSLHRTWSTQTIPTKEDIQEVLNQSSWSFTVNGTCTPPENRSGMGGSLCSAKGTVDTFTVNVNVMGEASNPQSGRVILSIE